MYSTSICIYITVGAFKIARITKIFFVMQNKTCYFLLCKTWMGYASAFNPSKCTHTAVSSEHTPGAVGSHCSSTRGAIGGSVPCSRAPQSWYWRRRECCSFTIPTFNPCRTGDSNPQPLDYKSDSLTIRPRLPPYQIKFKIMVDLK